MSKINTQDTTLNGVNYTISKEDRFANWGEYGSPKLQDIKITSIDDKETDIFLCSLWEFEYFKKIGYINKNLILYQYDSSIRGTRYTAAIKNENGKWISPHEKHVVDCKGFDTYIRTPWCNETISNNQYSMEQYIKDIKESHLIGYDCKVYYVDKDGICNDTGFKHNRGTSLHGYTDVVVFKNAIVSKKSFGLGLNPTVISSLRKRKDNGAYVTILKTEKEICQKEGFPPNVYFLKNRENDLVDKYFVDGYVSKQTKEKIKTTIAEENAENVLRQISAYYEDGDVYNQKEIDSALQACVKINSRLSNNDNIAEKMLKTLAILPYENMSSSQKEQALDLLEEISPTIAQIPHYNKLESCMFNTCRHIINYANDEKMALRTIGIVNHALPDNNEKQQFLKQMRNTENLQIVNAIKRSGQKS